MADFEKLWHRACDHFNVSSDVATRWHNRIRNQYSGEPVRAQHNLHLLDKKCKFLADLEDVLFIPDFLVFTLAFQYFHFNPHEIDTELNCTVFREFYTDAGINDVSGI